MSRVELSEFLDAYLGEVDELLAVANAQLVAIEQAKGARGARPREVRELFRALHTVKGLSAMVGLEPIVAIAHRMESGLRQADRAGGLLRPGAVDLLLQGVQAIEQRVASLAGGRPLPAAPDALLEALEALEGTAPPAASPRPESVQLLLDEALEAKLAPAERASIIQGVQEGRRAVCVRFSPSPELAAAGVSISAVRERLATVAEIVKVLPVASPSAPAGLSFALLALSSQPDAQIEAAVGLGAGAVASVAEPRSAGPGPELEPELADLDADEDGGGFGRRSFVRVDVGRLDQTIEALSTLIVGRASLTREVARAAERGADVRGLQTLLLEQKRQMRDLRAALLRVRMVPVSEILERVPLILRALRRSTGKSARLEVDAGRAELDKSVAEQISPAIVHLVRNAVDHAIEAPGERSEAGKPEEGLIRISCRARGNGRLELQISDDGRGVDAERIAARAGLPVPGSASALLQLMCRAGLSTRDQVTATSGRGMGMDIVRKIVVDQLGGELSLETAPGRGTTFTLTVPLTLSVVDAFTFECSAQPFVVPLSTVDEILDLDGISIVQPPAAGPAKTARLIERRGESLPLLRLDDLLGLERPATPGSRALVVRRGGEAVAFEIDRMLGQQEVVVRPLEDPLLVVPGIAGATDLGDGRATLVVDLFALQARERAS